MSKKSNRENVSVLPTGEAVYTPTAEAAPVGNGEAATAKPAETKRAKFLRLARLRVPRAEKALAQVSNLFRPGSYDCEERHLNEVEGLLKKALGKCRDNFVSVKPKAAPSSLFQEDTLPQHNGE